MAQVKVISQEDYDAWDEYVAKSTAAGFFHRIGWLRTITQTYGHKPQYLMATEHERVVGILPLFLISVPFSGCYLASDVFTSYGGVCADSREFENLLLEKASHLAQKLNARYVEIKNVDNLAEVNSAWQTKDSYCTLTLDISNGADEIWKGWSGKNRTNVRKAKKSGVTVTHGPEQIDDFYDLVAINMKSLGTPVHSRDFYQNILSYLPDDSQLSIARLSGKPIAGVLALGYKDTIQSFASVAIPEYRKMQPVSLIYWDLIERACESGYTTLDFGRSSWDSGTYQFKTQLGGQAVPLFYNYYMNKQTDIPEVHQDNVKFKLAIQFWQKLPLSITRLLGPRLIKYIA